MLFKRVLLEKILDGRKTQTRRLVKRHGRGVKVYEVGDIIGASAGYTKPSCHIQILSRFKQRLGEMTVEDARKEGCESLEEFKDLWISLFGRWEPRRQVWVYEFEVAKLD